MSNLSEYLVSDNGNSSFKNQIINGGFDVWQRGTSSSLINGYSADRWLIHCHLLTSGLNTIKETSNGKTYLKTTANFDGYLYPTQIIEDGAKKCIGKKMTLSFDASCTNAAEDTFHPIEVIFYSTYPTVYHSHTFYTTSNSMERYSVEIDCTDDIYAAGNSHLEFRCHISGCVMKLGNVQLEEGTIPTDFEQRPASIELALCQRYFVNYPNARFANNYAGFSGANSLTCVNYHHNVEMRVDPVVTIGTIHNTFTLSNKDNYNGKFGGMIYGTSASTTAPGVTNVSFDAEL